MKCLFHNVLSNKQMISKMTNINQVSFSIEQLEQSQILDQKFIQLMNSKKQTSEEEQFQFQIDEDQQEKIKAQFRNVSQGKQTMDYKQFRQSLGLLGREDSFISRIFHIIDLQKIGNITEEDYLKYIRAILHGTQFQHQLLGWKIISGGKKQLQIKDLSELFEQISIVWNALTGQIVQPKKKYIEQLFSILDVDQDQVITFQDYRVFYKQQPLIFGWFEYLNNIDVNDSVTKQGMQKLRNQLQEHSLPVKKSYKNAQQLKQLMQTQQGIIDNKMLNLIKQIENAANIGNDLIAYTSVHNNQLKLLKEQKSQFSMSQSSLSNLTHIGKFFGMSKTSASNSQISLASTIQQISRLKKRKQQMQLQQNKQSNLDMIKELQKLMDRCYKALTACSQFRQMKQLSNKYSPTKLKLKQVKIQAINKNQLRAQQKSKEQHQKRKKKNILVYFGHQNWNLVLNIMVGLRKSIRSLYELNTFLQLKSNHFWEQHQFLLGNKTLSGKNKQVYKFIQIAPVVFEKLRKNYGINNQQYQRSVGPQSLLNSLLMGNLTGLNQKCSTGKSGSFFYLTLDSKIFLKTIPKHQFLFFIQILENYYRHMKQFPNTLIVRIYGLYKLKIFQNKKKIDTIYFISMENIFKQLAKDQIPVVKIKQVYDLKGSLYGRSGIEGKQLKDNDWIERKRKINLNEDLKKIFKNQIKVDSKFFKANNINDYSLMVTIGQIDKQLWRAQRKNLTQDKSHNIFKTYKGGVLGVTPGQFYILSIIDILTVFEVKKKFQYAFKSTFLSKDVSCIPPAEYCKRFRNFMYETLQDNNQTNSNHSE